MADPGRLRSSGFSLVPLGAAVIAVVCCAGLPALTLGLGGLTLAAVLGIGAGVIAVAAVLIVAVVALRERSRRSRADREQA